MASVAKYETRSPDNEKTKKYDRQLRLWGDHGQSFLENANVCLINATAIGTETLKSLVLPGIGAFTILDGHTVKGEDVGRNFFLLRESIGANRAKEACKLLIELNPHVKGDYVDENCETLLETNPDFFKKFSVVIATEIRESVLIKLSQLLHIAHIPLLVCRAYGQIGYLRLQIPEHTIVESHPDDGFEDLRLAEPFPTLRAYVDSVNLEELDRHKHAHVPYVVLLLKALDIWKAKYGEESMPTYKDKLEFEEMLSSLKYKPKDDDREFHLDPQNFEEAIKARARTMRSFNVPDNVKRLFEDSCCENLSSKSKPFWIMVRALRDFVGTHGTLPLRGAIPDMISDSENYVKLATVYKAEADRQFEEILNRVTELLLLYNKPCDSVCEPEVRILCRNAHTLDVIRTRPIFEEFERPDVKCVRDALQETQGTEEPDIVYYILLRSVDKFYEEYKRYPGSTSDEMEMDIMLLKSIFTKLVQGWGLGSLNKDDVIHEMCRFGASELHTIASIVGGCAAQEVIKVVTQQYVPINNTFIYNGIHCSSNTYKL